MLKNLTLRLPEESIKALRTTSDRLTSGGLGHVHPLSPSALARHYIREGLARDAKRLHKAGK